MAANRFATMLHRNTNKITLILIYAVLEWILIVLLLLNSLFSYLIIKFAEFFGLKSPCLWCTRIDHIFDPAKRSVNMHRDLLCEFHCKEVSRLGYCSSHRKLVESQDMCEDCLSSRPEFQGSSKDSEAFPRMKGFGELENGGETVGENGGVSLKCSCCGACLDDGRYSSYALLKTSSWDILERVDKVNLITFDDDDGDRLVGGGDNSTEQIPNSACDELVEIGGNSEVNENDTKEEGCFSANFDEQKKSKAGEDEVDLVLEVEREKDIVEEEKPILIMKDKSVQVCVEEDVQIETPPQHLEFFLDFSGHTLVPIELIDSTNEEHHVKENVGIEIEGDDVSKDQYFVLESEVGVEEKEPLISESGNRVEKIDAFVDIDINEEPAYAILDAMEMEEDENSLVFHAKDSHSTTMEQQFEAFPLARWPSGEANEVQEMEGAVAEKHSDDRADDVACEEVAQENNENEADVSIGTEIPDLDITDEIQIEDSVHVYECAHEDPSTSSTNLYAADDGPTKVEEQVVESQSLLVQEREHTRDDVDSFQLEVNEIEEDKFPDTPTSMDSLNQLHKKLLMLEKRDSGTEESLDGSVTSELEGNDGVVTVERLKAALRAERKTLQVLYAELEEERSASAVAANQTMAMINRLQEEKAAMQMEALQYQRMMEEQSEYDQEALQLLNELMLKREREKQELEKELDGYRKKILEYETKEKIKAMRKSKDGSTSGFSSVSCSNAEDSDGLSIDLNQEAKEEDGFYNHQEYGSQNTPVDAVVDLEQSLADFEEERMSILEQLKVLEEKLMTLDDVKEQHFEDVESLDSSHEENGDHVDENGHLNGETNGHANGFPKELMNGKHHQSRRIAGQKGKSLLPLFDAICDGNGDASLNENGPGNGVHSSFESKFEMENKKLAIEEEVDYLYERLQALEADREFLKHCISSLKKGDKGMNLLQEILQHLRDLRSVELRVRNFGESSMI